MNKMIMFQMIIMMYSIFITMSFNSIPAQYKKIHPILMSLILLLMTIFMSISMSMFLSSHWFSYIMFLIMVGGLMILFMYFTSFSNNMKTSFYKKFLSNIITKLLLLIWFMFLIMSKKDFIQWYNLNIENMNLMSMNSMNFILNDFYQIMYMYNFMKNFPSIICMLYLLITLTFIVKMCIYKKLSLRKLN
nr:NADH dehydrogenase subunit 6 [Systasis sp. 1 HHL-2023a]